MSDRPNESSPREERIREAVRELPDVRPDAVFRARLKDAFVSGEIAGAPPAGVAGVAGDKIVPMRRRWPGPLALAAAAVIAVVFFAVRPHPAAEFAVIGGDAEATVRRGDHVARITAADAHAVAAGSEVAVASGSLELQWRDVVALRVNPGSVVLPTLTEGGTMQFTVAKGEVVFLTGPGFAGSELTVVTPEGRVEVVGTAFAVYRDDGGTCVCVLEGTASVGAGDADMERVPPSKRKVMPADGTASRILDIMPPHRDGLVDFVERARGRLAE
ncbi:FecR family protein [bacterium]|nr:FecR family protein [bacterium]